MVIPDGSDLEKTSGELIDEGRISVNGQVLKEQGYKVDPENDQVVNGKLVVSKEPPKVYWMFNKPDVVLTSSKSENGKVFDLPAFNKLPFRVFTAGRLDYRTEGYLLFLTMVTLFINDSP